MQHAVKGSYIKKISTKQTEARAEHFDVKIKQMDAELLRYKEQMSKMRDGPAKVKTQFIR